MTNPSKPIGAYRTRYGNTGYPIRWRFWIGPVIVYGYHRQRPWAERITDPTCLSAGALGVGISYAPKVKP